MTRSASSGVSTRTIRVEAAQGGEQPAGEEHLAEVGPFCCRLTRRDARPVATWYPRSASHSRAASSRTLSAKGDFKVTSLQAPRFQVSAWNLCVSPRAETAAVSGTIPTRALTRSLRSSCISKGSADRFDMRAGRPGSEPTTSRRSGLTTSPNDRTIDCDQVVRIWSPGQRTTPARRPRARSR